jgi:hypothetical protein
MVMNSLKRTLETKQLKLLQRMTPLHPWIEGSLVSTSRFCGKKNCACHHGGAKHPVLYVTWKENGKTVSLYIPRILEDDVRRWVQNYRKLKELTREVSDIQKQIVRLREDNP